MPIQNNQRKSFSFNFKVMLALAAKRKKHETNAFAAPTIMFLNTVINAPFVLHALHVCMFVVTMYVLYCCWLVYISLA